MLKRLKVTLIQSETEKFFEKYEINKTHELIPLKAFSDLSLMLKSPKTKN